MDAQLKTNLTSPKHWVRLVYMVLFAFFLYIASIVMSVVVVVQFVFSLVSGVDNAKLRAFGYSLTLYIKQALMFLSFNSEFKPFPFADWPAAADEPVVSDGSAEPAPKGESAEVGVAASEAEDATAEEDKHFSPLEGEQDTGEASENAKKDESKTKEPLVDPEAEKKILS